MNEYEFHPWEIWNGGSVPETNELVQVHMHHELRNTASKKKPMEVKSFAEWAWTHYGVPQGGGRIIAFRRAKAPLRITKYVRKYPDGCWSFAYEGPAKADYLFSFEVNAEGEPCNPKFERVWE
jgi:hypothetical protein